MRTPRAQPCLLASMKPSAVPWNQVAIMRPSSCQTVRSRSHSPASRQTAQDSTSSRIARRESASSLTDVRLARQEAKSAVAITVLRRVPNVPSAMPSPTRRSSGHEDDGPVLGRSHPLRNETGGRSERADPERDVLARSACS